MDRRQFYKVSEVAEILGFSRQGIYNLIRDGHLQSTTLPGHRTVLRISRSELVRMLKRKTAGQKLRQYQRVVDNS